MIRSDSLSETPRASTWLRNVVFLAAIAAGTGLVYGFLFARPILRDVHPTVSGDEHEASVKETASAIDQAVEAELSAIGLGGQLAPRAEDLTIARRLALGLAGTIPSLQEIRFLEQLPTDSRLSTWTIRLLDDRRTHDFLAERLTRAMIGVDEGPFVLYRRRRFVNWLSDHLAENTSYDELVRKIVTGEGLWTGAPEVNFFTSSMVEGQADPVVLAGRTSRAFLGMRIDCLQCHDDFLGTINVGSMDDLKGGTQQDFHGLAAFFLDVSAGLAGVRDRVETANYETTLLGDTEPSVVAPRFPFHGDLDRGGATRRERLARWLTDPDNRPFARATVNRMWAILCGKPLVEPVDHIPLDGPFPKAMEILADDFRDHQYDLRRLIRIIAATDAFRRSSAASFEITAQHEAGWAVFPLRRLRPDQAAAAIIQSTSLTPIDRAAPILERLLQFGQQNDFVQRFGDPGEDEFAERGETVTQRLLMLNGEMVHERITGGLSSSVRIASLSPDLRTAVEVVYLATLTRRPDPEESRLHVQRLEEMPVADRNAALMDLYWTLVNSLEFSWNH